MFYCLQSPVCSVPSLPASSPLSALMSLSFSPKTHCAHPHPRTLALAIPLAVNTLPPVLLPHCLFFVISSDLPLILAVDLYCLLKFYKALRSHNRPSLSVLNPLLHYSLQSTSYHCAVLVAKQNKTCVLNNQFPHHVLHRHKIKSSTK